MEYSDYLNSACWKGKRLEALRKAQHRCQTCNSETGLNVHHRKYPKVYGNEPVSDLIVLCHKCHKTFHDRHSATQQKIEAEGRISLTRKKYHFWVKTTDPNKLRALCNPGIIYQRSNIFEPTAETVLCKVCATHNERRN